MEIKVKYGLKRIDKLIDRLQKDIGIEAVLKNMKGYAVRLEKGHNDEGIIVEMINSRGESKGRLYADPNYFMAKDGTSYLFFEYFGTGEYAEMEHVGKSKHFIKSGYTEWFIPVDKVNKPLGYVKVNIEGQEFYIAHGVQPTHFLTDAEFESRPQNRDILRQEMEKMFREVCA